MNGEPWIGNAVCCRIAANLPFRKEAVLPTLQIRKTAAKRMKGLLEISSERHANSDLPLVHRAGQPSEKPGNQNA